MILRTDQIKYLKHLNLFSSFCFGEFGLIEYKLFRISISPIGAEQISLIVH